MTLNKENILYLADEALTSTNVNKLDNIINSRNAIYDTSHLNKITKTGLETPVNAILAYSLIKVMNLGIDKFFDINKKQEYEFQTSKFSKFLQSYFHKKGTASYFCDMKYDNV